MQKNKKQYNSSRIKVFLFFLFVAIVFWALTKFSREFTTTVYAKVNYLNIPETTALAKENIDEISFDMTANGFDFLFYKIKKPTIDIPVAEHYTKGEYQFTLSRSQVYGLITSQFTENSSIKNLSNEILTIKLEPIVQKKVKVLAAVDFSFHNGFKAVDSLRLQPDSVLVSGPLGSLKDLFFVETELVSAKGVQENISIKAKVKPPFEKVIALNPPEVTVTLQVAEFSEGEVSLPIEPINVPPNISLKIIPENVRVSFNASIDKFNSISAEDFRVVCDYSQRNTEENFMTPKLAKMPEGVFDHEFDVEKVDFLILK